MATKFIGFKHSKGDFTSEKTGEVINYNNYDFYFITGAVPGVSGYYPSSYQVKGAYTVSQVLGFDEELSDTKIISVLNDMLNKNVLMTVIEMNNKSVLTNLVKSSEPTVPHKDNK